MSKKEAATMIRGKSVTARQFGEMVKSISGTSDKITLAANYAIAQIYDHGNKDKLIQLFKSPAFNLQAGGLNKLGKEVLAYIRAHYPALTRTDTGEFKVNPKKASETYCPKAMIAGTGHSFELTFDQWRQWANDKPKADTSDKPVKVATVIGQVQVFGKAMDEKRVKGSEAEMQELAALLFAEYQKVIKELAKTGVTTLPDTAEEKAGKVEKITAAKAATRPAAVKVAAGPAPTSAKLSTAEKRAAKKEAAQRVAIAAENDQLAAQRAKVAAEQAPAKALAARAASALDAEMKAAHEKAQATA